MHATTFPYLPCQHVSMSSYQSCQICSLWHWQELRGEYVRHFLNGEFVVDRKREAHLCKSMLNKISREDGHAFQELAHKCCSTSNMVVKTTSHRRSLSHHTSNCLTTSHMTLHSFAYLLD